MRTLICNCKLYIDNRILDNCFILINDGLIEDFGIESSLISSYDAKYNAEGRLILPGIVDVHTHLRDQQLSYKEDFTSATSSAILGGVTSLIDMPNNEPPTDSPARLKERMKAARNKILANVGFTCKPSLDYNVSREMANCGAVAFKSFLYDYIIDGEMDTITLNKIMSGIAKTRKKLMIHCNIKASYDEVLPLVKKGNVAKLCRIEGHLARKTLSLAAKHGTRIHICHVSCPITVDIIEQYRNILDITSEVTIHHITLSYDLLEEMGPIAHVDPPLKSRYTAKTLLKLLRRDRIDIIVSDHAPHALSEKFSQDPKPGFPNLQLMMPALLTLVKRGSLSISEVMEKASRRPAIIFGLERRGLIKRGYYADLVEVDVKKKLKVKSDILASKARYTPFEGLSFIGLPVRTFVNGVCVNEHYTVIGRGGEGMILKSGRDRHEARP
ncbi:MAG: dihydroorotase family protein [Candidatus Nezhaarchaeota archaeon]|nr:dihydroorotase family protein [Candidatus Nezhaarchaeota archaeon]MCX8142022.1 dihydroorotase family protein [Candidatus Nezhaarchaeota archaeon]MDW8050197.1 dihydroorotase family protein [Nitrososphaerota archaeon]